MKKNEESFVQSAGLPPANVNVDAITSFAEAAIAVAAERLSVARALAEEAAAERAACAGNTLAELIARHAAALANARDNFNSAAFACDQASAALISALDISAASDVEVGAEHGIQHLHADNAISAKSAAPDAAVSSQLEAPLSNDDSTAAIADVAKAADAAECSDDPLRVTASASPGFVESVGARADTSSRNVQAVDAAGSRTESAAMCAALGDAAKAVLAAAAVVESAAKAGASANAAAVVNPTDSTGANDSQAANPEEAMPNSASDSGAALLQTLKEIADKAAGAVELLAANAELPGAWVKGRAAAKGGSRVVVQSPMYQAHSNSNGTAGVPLLEA